MKSVVYMPVTRSFKKEGNHVVSTDEMTGIQALEHKYLDKLPLPRYPATMNFEYFRHVTTSLIGFFDLASGAVYSPYLNEMRNETDFCEAVRQINPADPKKEGVEVFFTHILGD